MDTVETQAEAQMTPELSKSASTRSLHALWVGGDSYGVFEYAKRVFYQAGAKYANGVATADPELEGA